MKLKGRRAVVTGGTQGFGSAVLEAFLREGAEVSFCARDAAAVAKETERLHGLFPGRIVHGMAADVSRTESVDPYIDAATAALGGLDILVVNAGIYGPKGPIDMVDWNDWTDAIAVNLLGAVYTTRSALRALRASDRRSKILILSGGGATKPLPFLSAYAASKAGVVRYGETLAEELRDDAIDVSMIAPGALNTRLLGEILEAGPEVVGDAFYKSSVAQQQSGGTPLQLGADLCVFLASDQGDGITGKLISAQWDPWASFDSHREDLAKSDVYTLRRIVPEERGFKW
jgi:NAD(P)-dependent dehydrogenase (short-subunit alcohol dehydrogenase family)